MKFFYRYIDSKYLASHDGKGLQIQIFLIAGLVLCVLWNIGLSIYFLVIGELFQTFFAFIGITPYLIGFVLVRTGKIRIGSLFFICVIILNSFASAYYFGKEIGAEWLILIALLPAILYLDLSKTQKAVVIILSPILINLHSVLPEDIFAPYYPESVEFLRSFYTNMVVFSTIFILIVSKLISGRLIELRKLDAETVKIEAERLKVLSTTDELTKIKNRRAFFEYMDLVWKQSCRLKLPVAALMIDVDNFKKYNDLFGHLDGDKTLVAIAQCLKKQMKRSTDYVARFGGEEFICLLPFIEKNDVLYFTRKLVQSVEDLKIPHPMNGHSEYVTISVGVAHVIPNGNNSQEQFLGEADRALYLAKESGKNRFVVS